MSTDKLKRIYKENDTDRCIGFCNDKYIGKCFAISGIKLKDHEKDKLYPLIKDVLGTDCVECEINESIFCFPFKLDPYYKRVCEYVFYQNFYSNFRKETIEYFKPSIYVCNYTEKLESNLFSCVERKIIGHWLRVRHNSTKPIILVTKRPCYYCLPAIDKAYYIDDNKIFGIKTTFQLGAIKGFKQLK